MNISKEDFMKLLYDCSKKTVKLYNSFRVSNSYKLCNDYNYVLIKKSPFVNCDVIDLNKEYLKSLSVHREIINFLSVISFNRDKEDFVNLYRNLSDLQVNIIKRRLINYREVGSYLPIFNTIVLVEDRNINTINHELFHVASTGIDKNGDVFSGFSQCIRDRAFIGSGIDEGYTELLTNRYFYKDCVDKFYIFESLVMSLVEDIIGREKMEKLYFQGNLYGLIEELKKYSSEKEIRLFIRNVDFYNNLSISSRYLYFYKDELMTSLNEIGSYLFKVFYTKLVLDGDDIDIKLVKKFSKKLKNGLRYKNKKLYYFSMRDEVNIINEIEKKYVLKKHL